MNKKLFAALSAVSIGILLACGTLLKKQVGPEASFLTKNAEALSASEAYPRRDCIFPSNLPGDYTIDYFCEDGTWEYLNFSCVLKYRVLTTSTGKCVIDQ